jgi:hypothetical protein
MNSEARDLARAVRAMLDGGMTVASIAIVRNMVAEILDAPKEKTHAS